MSSEVTKLPGMMVHRFCVGKAKKKAAGMMRKQILREKKAKKKG